MKVLGLTALLLVSSVATANHANPRDRRDRHNYDEIELVRYEKESRRVLFGGRTDADFRTTTVESVGLDYKYDTTVGYILDELDRAPGTRPLYECQLADRDFFLSIHRSCEGQERVGVVGRVFENQVNGTIPLYRCYDGKTHAASTYADCEGLGNTEGVLGYIL